jgi:hypothetical protein
VVDPPVTLFMGLDKFENEHLIKVSAILCGDPDSDPQDPHAFRPPISGSITQARIRILPFSHKGVERTEIMLAKLNFNTKVLA